MMSLEADEARGLHCMSGVPCAFDHDGSLEFRQLLQASSALHSTPSLSSTSRPVSFDEQSCVHTANLRERKSSARRFWRRTARQVRYAGRVL